MPEVMRIPFTHQTLPRRSPHLSAAWLPLREGEVVDPRSEVARGITVTGGCRNNLHREPGKDQHPYRRQMESAIPYGQAMVRALQALKQNGFCPDFVIAHRGWGETLYLREVFPDARLIHLSDWYCGAPSSEIDFDPEFPATADNRARLRTWKVLHALNLTHCDVGISPTQWQRAQHPEIFRSKIQVQHEGIDLNGLAPDPEAVFRTPNGTVLKAGDPVITYVSRNLEPYRGFHRFMRALEIIQRRHPTCHAVIFGGDDVSYGKRPTDAPNWREKMLREVSLDPTRTLFTGKLPYNDYLKVLQVSAAHVYLTYPFVLSWSLLEAMASGCLVIGSRTAPVEEVIRDGENGLLVDFFDTEGIVERVVEALELLSQREELRRSARSDAQILSVERGVSGYAQHAGAQFRRQVLNAEIAL